MTSYCIRNNPSILPSSLFGTLWKSAVLFIGARISRGFPKLIPTLLYMNWLLLLKFTVSQFPDSIQCLKPTSNAPWSSSLKYFSLRNICRHTFYIFLKASITCYHLMLQDRKKQGKFQDKRKQVNSDRQIHSSLQPPSQFYLPYSNLTSRNIYIPRKQKY